jgi:hypothetical protein
MLQNGMREDAIIKLKEASQHFTEASVEFPDEHLHWGCKAYTEFLLGNTEIAEQLFTKALALECSDRWFEDDTKTELCMFPVPEDKAYLAAVQLWFEAFKTSKG